MKDEEWNVETKCRYERVGIKENNKKCRNEM